LVDIKFLHNVPLLYFAIRYIERMEDLLKRRYIEERVSGEDATRIFGNNMITNEERIEVLSKIEKIMAHTQTESGAVNVNEMAIANRLVKELIDKYEISIDEIKATSDKSTLVKNIESELIDQKGIRHWVMSLSSIVFNPDLIFDENRLSEAKKFWTIALARFTKNLPDFESVVNDLRLMLDFIKA